ncbi:hypothetical protein ACT3UJ_06290 [Halomonas sp. 86]|uniref:hypothetical protein n=1 Tax=unclassified Halomonas TaxID=2609666 RepID=UPI0040337AB8
MNKVLSKMGVLGQGMLIVGLVTSLLHKLNPVLYMLVVLGFVMMTIAFANIVRLETKRLREREVANRYTIAMLIGITDLAIDLAIATFLTAVSQHVGGSSLLVAGLMMTVSLIFAFVAYKAYAKRKSYNDRGE